MCDAPLPPWNRRVDTGGIAAGEAGVRISALAGGVRRTLTSTITGAAPPLVPHAFRAVAAALAAALGFWVLPAAALDPFPSKTVRIVLPQPAGGAVDLIARTLADKLSPALGQPVIVENQPGANGGLAAANVARSAPDGHTLFFAIDTNMAVNPHLYPSMTYDPFTDFEPISLIVTLDLVLVANPGVPAGDLRELIAYSKINPDKLNYASVGQGSIQHLGMEMIKLRSGLRITHVPYRGTAPATTDLVSGVIQAMLTGPQAAQPQVEAGKLKALAVAGPSRSKLMPQVATIREQGVDRVDFSSWFALFAPSRTPPAAIQRLTAEVAKATADAGVRAKLEGSGLQVVGSTAAQLVSVMRRDSAKWRDFIKETGITMPK